MSPGKPQDARNVLVWWIFWAAIGVGMGVIYFVLKPTVRTGSQDLWWIALVPLVNSVLVRFVLLPRIQLRAKALPVFVLGVALADGSAMTGLFLGGKLSGVLLGLAYVAWAMYAPYFAKDYE